MRSVLRALSRLALSIRFRIIVTAITVFSIGAFMMAFGIVNITNSRAEETVSLPLADTATAICVALANGEPLPPLSLGVDGLTYYQVLSGDGIESGYLMPGPPSTAGSQPSVPVDCLVTPKTTVVRDLAELEDSRQLLTERITTIKGTPYRIITVAALRMSTDTVEQLVLLFRIGIPLLVILVAALLWVVVTRALRPVDALRSLAEEISESTMDKRLPVVGYDDELTRLSKSLNSMLDRLERANDNQRQFVSDASHELRSPAATIVVLSEVLDRDPSRVRELLPQLHAEANRLASLVDVLIELARADEQKALPQEPVFVHDLLLSDAERIQVQADLQGVSVDTTGIQSLTIQAANSAVVGIVRNLTDNALRHAKSEIWLRCYKTPTVGVIEVGDDGPGVPLEMRKRIFDRFSRLDVGRGRNEGGTGIGLALVRDLVTAYGGTVCVRESAAGGALFIVELPLD